MADYKHGEMDITVQEQTFHGFIKFVTWAVLALLAVLVFLAVFTA